MEIHSHMICHDAARLLDRKCAECAAEIACL